jgi:glycosyltransferase involved in cell wall biosynthesis
MRFLNRTNNTIYLGDIEYYIPYTGGVQSIGTEWIKKSKHFQLLVKMGQIEIVDIGDSRIERNLKQLEGSLKPEEIVEETEEGEGSADMQVKIKGHFEEAGGYAKVNRNLALGLSSLGVDVCIESIGPQSDLNEIEIKQLSRFKKKPSQRCIHIDSVVPSFSHFGGGIYKILYTTIESYSVPKQFLDTLHNYNEIWVVSDFCKNMLKKYKVDRDIFVLPDSINTKMYKPGGDKFVFRPELQDFVFLSVFGWSYRKGYDLLLKSYLQEFSGSENVSLLIVSRFNNNPKQDKIISEEVKKHIKQYGGDNPPHIARCSKVVPEFMMPNLYRSCDAFVLFSRGEGFCIPYCEASLCGLPVVGTNCSGQTMFLNDSNSYLVDIDSFEKMPEGRMHVHYWDGQIFPAYSSAKAVSRARTVMRSVFKGKPSKGKRLQQFVTKNYDIKVVATRAKERLERIWNDHFS